MGTRNLTMVISEGKTRIAQYGQWDGYPEGQGRTVINFMRDILKKNQLKEFKAQLRKCRFVNKKKQQEIDKHLESLGITGDWMTMEQAKLVDEAYPLFTRDNGAEILNLVFKSTEKTIWLHDQSTFAADSLFCEWAYVIDLDKKTLEVYTGFNQRPVKKTDRFYYLESWLKKQKDSGNYHPITLLKKYKLNDLPTYAKFKSELNKLANLEEA